MPGTLEQFVKEVNGTGHLRVEKDFGDGFVRLRTSEADRRQAAQDIRCIEDVVLELLRNSCDAHATHVFLAVSRSESKRSLTIVDDGCGIPSHMHELVFEPRVTSKLDTSHKDAWGFHGRGMALFSIRENAESARVLQSAPDLGCSILVRTDASKLPERTDQSTFPSFTLEEQGKVKVLGPRNMLRCACEFAIESRDKCSVYVGSPAEVCATLYAYGMSSLSTIDRLFPKDDERLPLVKRLAVAGEPHALAETAAQLGLEMSDRTARRIMDGHIEPLESMLDRISIDSATAANPDRKNSRAARKRRFKLETRDADALASSTERAYRDIAERYYLDPAVKPNVRATSDRITISIPVVHKD